MLFLQLLSIAIRSQMQYRVSFFILLLAHFLSTFVDILGIWVLFDRFKLIQGWTLPELALVYGVLHMGFATVECFACGFDTFHQIVKNGDFDRFLLRPANTLLQVASREVQLIRFGRFSQGLLVLLWSCFTLHVDFFSFTTVMIFLSFIGITSFFYALYIVEGAICFWTTEEIEILNIATFGSLEAGQYPMTIYEKGFRLFFTFIIPLASVAYYPLATALHHETLPRFVALLLPGSGLFFLYLACQLWHMGVRRYVSTGS